MALTESQIFALNSLTYAGFDQEAAPYIGSKTADALMQQAVNQGWTVGEYVEALQCEFGDYPSKFDSSFDVLLSDPTLSNMQIQAHQHMSGSKANMIVFTSDSASEAVIAFQGSQSVEDWWDNFEVVQGDTGTKDGISSEYQEFASDYVISPQIQSIISQYDTVTTTGHSKGGNNATYCAVMNDSVDRSVTFDAQGYSDAFFKQYGDRIARKQGSIDNYSVADDIVNPLLNSIGQQHYIARDLPDNYDDCIDAVDTISFMLGHEPVALDEFFYGDAEEVPQDPGAAAFGRLLNTLLREHPEDAEDIYQCVDGIFNGGLLKKSWNLATLQEVLAADVGPLVRTFLVYIDTYPEDVQAIIDMVGKYNPEVADGISKFVDVWQSPWLAPLRLLVHADIRYLDGLASGEDMTVPSISSNAGAATISAAGLGASIASAKTNEKVFNTETYRELARRLHRLDDELQGYRSAIDQAADMCDKVDFRLSLNITATLISAFKTVLSGTADVVLHGISRRVASCSAELDELADKLLRVASAIEDHEDRLVSAASSMRASDIAPHANA